MRTLVVLLGLLPAVSGLFSCRSSRNAETVNNTAGPVSDTAVAAGIDRFGFDLLAKLATRQEDLVCSPYSISSALAVCYDGAREETAREMSRTLYFDADRTACRSGFRNLNDSLSVGNDAELFRMANGLWAQKDYRFLEDFTGHAAACFDAAVRNLDFSDQGALEQSRQTINGWVNEQTAGKIPELFKPDVLSNRTRLVVTNAVYFKSRWLHPFNEENTAEGTFYSSPGNGLNADFMNRQGLYYYYEDPEFRALEMPYAGRDFVMAVILPVDVMPLQEAASKLKYRRFLAITGNMYKTEVSVSLPRFTARSDLTLNRDLKDMGMEEAFGKDADFSGMTGSKDLYIDVVVHQAFMEVNEKGTEAAAATGAGMALKSVFIENPKEFNADHPFFYAVMQKKTGLVLFEGWLAHPGSGK